MARLELEAVEPALVDTSVATYSRVPSVLRTRSRTGTR
jgi:hypothetical protein